MKKPLLSTVLIVLSLMFYKNIKAQTTDGKENARIFVQHFFDTYSELVSKWNEKKAEPFYVVFSNQRNYFAPAFRKAIMKYIKTRSITPASLGIYLGRPFNLEEIDSVTRYLSENGSWVGRNRFWVDIHNLKNGQSEREARNSEPILFVEVTKETGHWEITDFYYPGPHGGTSLLEGLQAVSKSTSKKQ